MAIATAGLAETGEAGHYRAESVKESRPRMRYPRAPSEKVASSSANEMRAAPRYHLAR